MSASPDEQRRDQERDVLPGVLVVGVRVDDDVGAGAQTGVDARHEGRGQPLAAPESDDVLDPVRARDRRRVIARAVIDHERLDRRRCRESTRGRSASVAGSVSASFRHGIWMMSFMASLGVRGRDQPLDGPRPRDRARAFVTGLAHPRRAAAIGRKSGNRRAHARPDRERSPAPLSPSTTNIVGSPASVVVTTGLFDKNASSVTYPKSSSNGG